ncbi:MAG: hypothetical protein ACKO91_17575, partial [Acidimicrobiales bacterium]
YPSPGNYANAVQATDDGGLRALVVIETPNAPVDYRFPIDGTTIIQTVHHRNAAHPVIADPKISWGWLMTIFFNKSETNNIALGSVIAALFIPKGAVPFTALSAYAQWAHGRNACLRVTVRYFPYLQATCLTTTAASGGSDVVPTWRCP